MRRLYAWLAVFFLLALSHAPASARVGVPVKLSWDYTGVLTTGMVVQYFQVQKCLAVGGCSQTCTLADVPALIPTVGTGNWGSLIASGSWAYDNTLKAVTFNTVSARYARLIETSEGGGNPWLSASELRFWVGSTQLAQSSLAVLEVDSQETSGANNQAWNAIDNDTTTIWHTQWFTASPPPPHEIIVDLGSVQALSEFDYLPRQDGQINGTIGGYQFYVQPGQSGRGITTSVTDTDVVGGSSYKYQVVAVGIINGSAARSTASNTVCTYVKAAVRGRPSEFGDDVAR